MEYGTLTKIYYKNPDQYLEIYKNRVCAFETKHFDFLIKQFNRRTAFPAFLCYTEEMMLLAEKIYKQQENFLQLLTKVSPILLNQFNLISVLEEVKSTNEIEGIYSTRRELKEIIESESKSSRFFGIIKKYKSLTSNEKLNFQTCEDVRKFYDDFAHSEVILEKPSAKLDGKIFRKDSVDITSDKDKTLHRGAYPEEKIIELMSTALEILNNEKIPTLVRIPIFHYFFEYIHPFYDGNGRTARFIVSYFLAKHFHYLPALRLSIVIKKQRRKYYKLFQETDSEINCGDLTPFVTSFMQIISDTFADTEFYLNRKIRQVEENKKRLFTVVNGDELTLKIYGILLESSLFFGSGVTMSDLMKLTGKSINTIKSRLNSIPEEHIVTVDNKKIFYKLNMMILKNK